MPSPRPARRWILLDGLAVAAGVALALRRAWLCDDAFLSFRYARNLVEGHGLVFNVGERVEGFTNFLWTLGCAAGLELGVPAEIWSVAWGVAFFGGSILLLAAHHRRAGRQGRTALPVAVAAWLAVLHFDWTVWATSGLETSAVTFLALLGHYLLTAPEVSRRRAAAAGAVLALAALTRPDAVVFAALGGVWLLAVRPVSALPYALAFAAVWVPPTVWRVQYYGDFFPNTYWAKSADRAWWSQGLRYVQLYFERYWPLAAALPGLAVVAWLGARAREGLPLRRWALTAAWAVAFTAAVARVGGDFMFARMLIPATPFLLLLVEETIQRLPRRGAWVAAVAVAAAMTWTPCPVSAQRWRWGVADEWTFYRDPELEARYQRTARILRHAFDGLPVRVAFLGSEARLVYQARIPVAIESQTGLTDAVIARQPLARRGRPGHEKIASLRYLIVDRRAHFAFHPAAARVLGLDAVLPRVEIRLDGVVGRVLHWDPVLMAELRTRGAVFDDWLAGLDAQLDRLDGMDDRSVAELYLRAKAFYLTTTPDPVRESRFRERMRGVEPPLTDPPGPPPAPPPGAAGSSSGPSSPTRP